MIVANVSERTNERTARANRNNNATAGKCECYAKVVGILLHHEVEKLSLRDAYVVRQRDVVFIPPIIFRRDATHRRRFHTPTCSHLHGRRYVGHRIV